MSAKLVTTIADRGVTWSAQRIPTAINNDFLDQESLFFHSNNPSVILTRLSGPCSRPTTSQKIVAPGIEPGISVSVPRNSDNFSIEVYNDL
jgi:hypothetical protein